MPDESQPFEPDVARIIQASRRLAQALDRACFQPSQGKLSGSLARSEVVNAAYCLRVLLDHTLAISPGTPHHILWLSRFGRRAECVELVALWELFHRAFHTNLLKNSLHSQMPQIAHGDIESLKLIAGNLERIANEHAGEAGGTESVATTPKRRGGRKATVNARMLEIIQSNVDAFGWNCRQWAEYLKCAKSTVVATPTWKDLAMGRERDRAEHAKDRRRRPKASDQRSH